ncbi:MAG: hypothetical protein AB7U98_01335 [Candidatus Nitrosocosmicus sp.]
MDSRYAYKIHDIDMDLNARPVSSVHLPMSYADDGSVLSESEKIVNG